uniref:Uncharacterized protein n=1 Tax=Amphora coffeiformis TaxID=265554 RepID=A0A7S3KYE9_9STRA|mmetsp:Transcript_4065/g.8182  ORF Transcript_4065/g.8182 Transcript_4065/m.8182 type:complete len:252 (+) Transcript_4065:59-814(+)|eukprot:scaffold4442_cov125-Amphora_coffeaeformis.AAC.32
MMIRSFFLLSLSTGWLATTGEAFVARALYLPKPQSLVRVHETSVIRTAARFDPNPDDTTTKTNLVDPKLVQLQHEYKVLQERLLQDVVLTHDQDDAETIEEQMIEIAQQATRRHEEHQKDILREAQHNVEEAQETRQRLRELRQQDKKIPMEFDVYDQLAFYNDYQELAAKHKVAVAKTLLKHLEENEKKLHAMLDVLKQEHQEHRDGNNNKHVKQQEKMLHSHHSSFLDNVKGAILAHPDILISLDPHIL